MSSCSVNGDFSVGGLVGYSYYASVFNSTSDGGVSGRDVVGGLIGYNNVRWNSGSGVLSNSMAAGRVQGRSNVGPRVGPNGGTVTSTVYDMQGTGFSMGTDLEKKDTRELTAGSAVTGLGGSWTYKSGYYPRPKSFETAAKDGIRAAAAFAATPIYLNEGDSAANVNHAFKVPTRTADDSPITWSASPADMADIDQTTGIVTPKYKGTLALTGKSGPHSKTYALTVNNISPATEYRAEG
jgi:hypothetical protein